jgi:flagellar hook protein FlgE
MELKVNGGAPQTVSITASGASLTAADVATAIDALDHVSASVDGSGNVVLQSEKNGTASTLKIDPPATNSLASLVGLNTNLVVGTESAASNATDLNDLTTNLVDYAPGDVINVTGTDADAAPVSGSFTYGTDGTTLGDLIGFLNNQYTGATATFDAATQKLLLSADATGEANLSLSITDPPGQTKKMDWSALAMGVVANGTGPDEVASTVEVFDAAGTSHLISFDWERQDDGTWNGSATMPASEGTVVNGAINGLTFNANGSLSTPSIAQIDVQFNAQPAQTVTLALGTPGDFDGITQFGTEGSVIADDQDGYGVGELANLSVGTEGFIEGFFTNGQTFTLGQFGVATFANEQGLQNSGDNYWSETPNSGQLVLAGGKFGVAGEVVGGTLEESNVDTAEEFVRMIQAQRGFQANARVITAQNEILQDVMQIT